MRQVVKICKGPNIKWSDPDKELWEILEGYVTVYEEDNDNRSIQVSEEIHKKISQIQEKHNMDTELYTGKFYWSGWNKHIQTLSFIDVWELKRSKKL